MTNLSFEEFRNLMKNGESREKPGLASTYVLVEDQGKEIYYEEWDYISEEDDEMMVKCYYEDYKKYMDIYGVTFK